jgi:ClpP class serine protease
VQSDLIGQLIRRRAVQNNVAVTAVIGDVGASGGYWLACAGDQIRANRLSIVGSIGVISGGFGFDKLIARYDIERRLYTAGENKARNESFSPERPQDVVFTKELLADCHEMFKSWVRERRGSRLTGDEAAIFDGGYMLGEKARTLGLIDGFGDVDSLVKELGGDKAKPYWLRPRRPRGLLRLITRGAVESLLDVAEEKIMTPRLR